MHTNQPVVSFQSQSCSFSFMAPLLGTIKYLAFYFYSHLFFPSCLPFGHFGKMKVMAFPLIFSREYGGSEGEWASCPRLVLAERVESVPFSREHQHMETGVVPGGTEASEHVIGLYCIQQDASFQQALQREQVENKGQIQVVPGQILQYRWKGLVI